MVRKFLTKNGRKLLSLLAVTYFLSGEAVSAAGVNLGVSLNNGRLTSADYPAYVKALYNSAVTLGTTAATLMIVYSGYIYLTSQGDTTKTNSAKDILTGAIIGLLILWLIKIILDFIGLPTFGT